MKITDDALVLEICKRPAIFVGKPSLDKVLSFISGWNYAKNQTDLFREWLVVRVGYDYNSMHWTRLIKEYSIQIFKQRPSIRNLSVIYTLYYSDFRKRGEVAILREYKSGYKKYLNGI